ncbi:MAG TPA: hypothetical protein VF310_10920, partial [Vicinamibacteria bacterium]
GINVYTRGFGSYKHLLPLGIFQVLVQQSVAVLGILLAIAGLQNVYAAPEFSMGASSQWTHLLAHLTIGLVVPPLIIWGLSSLVMFVTKKVARRPATA